MKVSVVIPCYYSEATIAKVVHLTIDELEKGGFEWEFVLVNDGSKDGTFEQISLLCAEDPRIVGVDCAKNLGQHAAIMAGLQYTDGDAVMLMDDDMQTHPSQCLKLLNALRDNPRCDVVFAEWKTHREAVWRRLGSNFATWSMRVMTNRPKDVYSSNFFVMRRHVRDEVVRYTGPYPYVQGLLFRATDSFMNVQVEHFEREEGQSGYTLKTLVKLWTSVLGFSMLPLRAASITGAIMGVLGLIAALAIVIAKVSDPSMQAGWPSIMATMLICSGVILLFLGIIGEYIGRLFISSNNSPQYVVRETIDRRSA